MREEPMRESLYATITKLADHLMTLHREDELTLSAYEYEITEGALSSRLDLYNVAELLDVLNALAPITNNHIREF